VREVQDVLKVTQYNLVNERSKKSLRVIQDGLKVVQYGLREVQDGPAMSMMVQKRHTTARIWSRTF